MTSQILALKITRMLYYAASYVGKNLINYWTSTITHYLENHKHTGPRAEAPSHFYRMAATTTKIIEKEAPNCDIDKDLPTRIVEAITENQLSEEEKEQIKSLGLCKQKSNKYRPREVHDFEWKRKWQVLPTRHRLHRFGITPNSQCPNCRAEETISHALLECGAAKSVWRLVARCFSIRPPPALERNRGCFARLVVAITLFVIWKRRCLAEVKNTPVRAAYPALAMIRQKIVQYLAKQLEAGGEDQFLRRWHTKFFFVRGAKLRTPIIPY